MARLSGHEAGAQGQPNYGLLVNPQGTALAGDSALTPPLTDCSTGCGLTNIATHVNGTVSQRPVLEVLSNPAAAAGNAIVTPKEGQLTAKRVNLQAKVLAGSVDTVRFQYLIGAGQWADVPTSALSTPTGGTVSSQDISVSGPVRDRRSSLVVLDVSALPGGDKEGPVHVRASLHTAISSDGGVTEAVNFRLDRRGIDGAPTEDVGPGDVSLLSGEFSLTETDVSVDTMQGALELTPTYRLGGSRTNTDMFGPGWDAGITPDGGDLPYKNLYDDSEVKQQVVERDTWDPSTWNWELFAQTGSLADLEPLPVTRASTSSTR